MEMNQLQKALVNAGLATWNEKKARKKKAIRCKECGYDMINTGDSNVIVCSNPKCDNMRVFEK